MKSPLRLAAVSQDRCMATLRSTRLERLLGVPVADATHAHVHALISGAVPEDYDLDFKREPYGRNDAAKRDLCGDVAAMANTSGGLIILGLDEDEHGNATAAPEVTTSAMTRNAASFRSLPQASRPLRTSTYSLAPGAILVAAST